jgi:hypothetical protein
MTEFPDLILPQKIEFKYFETSEKYFFFVELVQVLLFSGDVGWTVTLKSIS